MIKGWISITIMASLTSRASTFLPRYSGVRPTIKPARKTTTMMNISMFSKPEPMPLKTTLSIIIDIGTMPASGLRLSCILLTEPFEVPVVMAAQVAAATGPSLASFLVNHKAESSIKIAGSNHAEPLARTTSRFVHQHLSQQVSQGTEREALGMKLAGVESFPQPGDFLRAWSECVGDAKEELGIVVLATFHGPSGSTEILLEQVSWRRSGNRGLDRDAIGRAERTGSGDHGSQGYGADRLGQEIHGPQLHRRHRVGHAAVRRDDHYRSLVARVAKTSQSFPTIHDRHLQVKQDEIGRRLAELRQRRVTVSGFGHQVSCYLQGRAEDEPDIGLVVDDENSLGGVHGKS